jgi:hypothetical protein
MKTRNFLHILLAGLWVNASEFIRNQILLVNEWIKHYQSFGMSFPSAPINGLIWVLWGFVFAAVVYVLAQKFTLMQTFALSWVIGFFMMWLVIWNLNVLPMAILPLAIPLSLIECFGAAYICTRNNKSTS